MAKSTKKPGATTTGRVINVKADMANWRRKIQKSRIKFDDDQKEIYLVELRKTGRKCAAAIAAGVSGNCVAEHRKNDPDFAEASAEAVDDYRKSIAAEVHRRGALGWETPVYQKGERVLEPMLNEDGSPMLNEDGQPRFVKAVERRFSDSLLILEAKRADPSYREKQTLDLNATGGGVLLAPAGITPEDFAKECEEANAEADKKHGC